MTIKIKQKDTSLGINNEIGKIGHIPEMKGALSIDLVRII